MAIQIHGDVAMMLTELERFAHSGEDRDAHANAVTLEMARLARIGMATQGPQDESSMAIRSAERQWFLDRLYALAEANPWPEARVVLRDAVEVLTAEHMVACDPTPS